MMTYFYVSVVYTAVNMVMAFVIYRRSRHSLLVQSYLFCAGSLTSFGILGFLLGGQLDGAIRKAVEAAVIFLYSLLPFFFLHLVVIFSRRFDILRSKGVILALYAAGLFCYITVLLGLIPSPLTSTGVISTAGYIFYVTWMSIYFCIGIALLYSSTPGFSERQVKSNFLFIGFTVLLLLLPGPFSQSVLSGIFHQNIEWYFFSSTLALSGAVYLVFRHKIIINTPYETLKSALAVMNDILIKTNETFHIELVRGAVVPLLGYTEKELVGRSLGEIIEQRYYLDHLLDYVFRGKMKESFFDAEVIRKDGESIPIYFSFTPVFANEEIAGFVAVGRNIIERKRAEEMLRRAHDELELRVRERTADLRCANEILQTEIAERKRAEEGLRRGEEKFRLITENIADLIAVLDVEGRRLYNSPSYKSLLGGPDELRGTDSFQEIHPDDRERIRRAFRETVRTGVGQRAEYRFLLSDGTIRFIESQGSVIRDGRGAVASVIVVGRDVTEKKNLEQQFIRAQRLDSIGTLAGGIAHDFNNILAIILGHSGLLESDPKKFSQSVSAIKQTVDRGSALVRQLLTFARKADVVLEALDINREIRDLVLLLRETFPKTIELITELADSLPVITIDRSQLHQTLLNLCVNARDAIMDHSGAGRIVFRTQTLEGSSLRRRFDEAKGERYIGISISDSGSGMDELTKSHMFEPFYTTKEKGKGTGLGLAVVYGVIKSVGGLLDVESQPGAGTTFHLYVPVPRREVYTLPAQRAQVQDPPGGSETILVVEDEEFLLDFLSAVLAGKGYRVLKARDGEGALELFERRNREIDLVLSDLGLPKQGGFETFLRMKMINPDVRAIIASGYLDPDLKARILRAGVSDIFLKPYAADLLLERIRAVLTQAKVSNHQDHDV